MNTTRVCQGALKHSPRYAEVDRHHLYPKYLSALLNVPERRDTVDLCAGCHDTAHHVLHHLINTGTVCGHHLPYGIRAVVYPAWRWWQATIEGNVGVGDG